MTIQEWLAVAPFMLVMALGMLVIIVDLIWPDRPSRVTGTALVGLLVAGAVTVIAGPIPGIEGQLPATGQSVLDGVYVRDQLTTFLDLLFIVITILTVLFAPDYLAPRGLPVGEFTATLLFAISGAMLLAGGHDLLLLFIGLELLVLPGYLLAGFAKRDGLSTEGAIKYFLLGSFSSAILLFGLAFVFGFTGSTRIDGIAEQLQAVVAGSATWPVGLLMGLALIITGGAFKIAAVPFHYWTPDAYQGSPTPVTGYLSVAPKIAAFALLIRLLVEALGPMRAEWGVLIGVLAAVTMTVGNLSALGQDNIKRMLGYSSIAHTGYIMVGLAVFAVASDPSVQAAGIQGVLFYSVAYAFMNLGAFACVSALQRRPGVTSQIDTFAGLGRRAPLLGVVMTLFLLSLVGIPPTAGFFGKAVIVISAIEGGGWLMILAVLMMLNAAAAAFYYLRVVVVMYMREAPEGARSVTVGTLTQVGLVIAAIGTIAIGLLPAVTSATLDWTMEAARSLFGA
ncbi:MAG: NADH-quinone oxidoreductase subunit N [Chloroflexi bacterium]|nr:NADH-quinone oxidoreductase subunit N [Chloroflexota bacterium]